MIYTYRGQQYEIEAPDWYLEALMDAEVAETAEEREDAAEQVAAWDAETKRLLPQIARWQRG